MMRWALVATYDNTGSLQNTYRYSPYGSVLSSSTPDASPYFTWVGTQGYRSTNRPYAEFYVRARHYSNSLQRWTTVDPLWPTEPGYPYVSGSPTSASDRDGTQPCVHVTQKYKNLCASGDIFACCAAGVSNALCELIKLGIIACNVDCTLCFPDLGSYLECLLARNAACLLENQTGCQNKCMSDGYRTDPVWQNANRVCRVFGLQSKKCCVASVLAEQKVYDKCAKMCFPGLSIIPYNIRTQFALKVLHCCG